MVSDKCASGLEQMLAVERKMAGFCLLLLSFWTITPARKVLRDATTCPMSRRHPHVVDETYPKLARSPHPLVSHCLLGPFASVPAPLEGEPCFVPALQKFGEIGRAQEPLKAYKLWEVRAAAVVVSAVFCEGILTSCACCSYLDLLLD